MPNHGITLFRDVVRRLSPSEVDNNFQTLLEMFIGSAGMLGKRTQADLFADLAHPVNTPAIVMLDSDPAKDGTYIKVGASGSGSWDKSNDSRLELIAAQLTTMFNNFIANFSSAACYSGTAPYPLAVDFTGKILLGITADGVVVGKGLIDLIGLANGIAAWIGDSRQCSYYGSGVWPLLTDNGGRILLGFDASTGKLVGAFPDQTEAITTAVSAWIGDSRQSSFTGSGVWPLLTDNSGRILLGFDASTGKLVGAFPAAGISRTTPTPLALADYPASADINHLLFYGQSLAVGAQGLPLISTTQPYSNVTFNGGPRASAADFSALIPLVEDILTPPDGGANRGETVCSAAANHAVTLAAMENGLVPASHIILASTAGHGGYTIAQLEKGAAWYSQISAHATGGKTRATAGGDSYAVHAIGWLQGENDVVSATSFAVYRAKLLQLQRDMAADISAISGQASPIYCLTYQVSYGAGVFADIAKAQLDLAQQDSRFTLVTPCYHLPFASDHVHLTAVGYNWIGHYFGRAYKQLVIDKVKPQWLNPISATARGTAVTIRFSVPVKPLLLDTITLAATTDHGFKITDSTGTVPISAITIQDGDQVLISLGRTLTATPVVRYALDYLGSGLTIIDGASGNLRDSEPATVSISGDDYPLYNICPHFELTIIPLS